MHINSDGQAVPVSGVALGAAEVSTLGLALGTEAVRPSVNVSEGDQKESFATLVMKTTASHSPSGRSWMSQLVSLAATRQYVICSAGAPSALNPIGPMNTSNMPTSTGRSVGIGPQLKVITAPDRVAFSVFGKGLVASLTDHEVGAVGVGATEGS